MPKTTEKHISFIIEQPKENKINTVLLLVSTDSVDFK